MAESDTILQLGIEAAREGNREEARNLFGLLTRQDPNNVQAWLWLAGVAEGPDQRRVALERVVELDPTNEMAVKGLQAMGARPTSRLADDAAPTVAAAAVPPAPEPSQAEARELTDEERYAAELDSAFDDYDALPRAEVPPRESLGDADALDADAVGARGTPRGTARERSAARRGATPVRSGGDDDDYGMGTRPIPGGPSPLLLGLLGLIVAILLCVALYSFLGRGRGTTNVANNATAAAATAQAGFPAGGATSALPGTGTDTGLGGTGTLTSTGTITPTTALTSTIPIATNGEAPAATAVPAPPAQPLPAASANPNLQVVPVGTTLEANGWAYTYPDPNFVLIVGKQAGGATAQGTYVHVLALVTNNTGTSQPLPAGFFALKDAQGNVYQAQPQVSSALVQRGINADVGMEDAIPANGVQTSVYLVFDVPPGAQNLTLFAAGKNDQGWQVLSAVP